MPSQAVLEHAFRMMTGVDRHTIDGMTAENTLAVTHHLHAVITTRPSQLDPRVRNAAQQANGSAEQLIRNLLALVTASSPVLPANHDGNRSRMPRPEVSRNAIAMLPDVLDTEPPEVRGNVMHHLQNIATLRTDELASDVRRAARAANNDPEQLVRNLLAMVRANPLQAASDMRRQMLADAMNMVTGAHDTDLTEETGRNTFNVINHLQDIATKQLHALKPEVRQAVQEANNDPAQLVRNLLALVTARPAVLSDRPGSVEQPAMPSRQVQIDAMDMITDLHDTDLSKETGRNTFNVINHLHDIATLSLDELKPPVRQAAEEADNDPKQLVRNLLALATATPPVLSDRPGSSVQPANPPDEGDQTNGANDAPQASRPAQLIRSNAFNAERYRTVVGEGPGAATPSRPGTASRGS
ncbi:hypothetical protein [Rhizobacter sp. Root1221]|uniref:hypothetical protein n=1 Tax=Rhizobacter sp. Root1221 TaxID=1736433 RepID=UPI0006F4250E|nr:hypothetical protein [Rhizobacter sp. Root1221]KQV85930.1 hypothetical protein ASC87_29605 [Rhizobacter sp. Root1221]